MFSFAKLSALSDLSRPTHCALGYNLERAINIAPLPVPKSRIRPLNPFGILFSINSTKTSVSKRGISALGSDLIVQLQNSTLPKICCNGSLFARLTIAFLIWLI